MLRTIKRSPGRRCIDGSLAFLFNILTFRQKNSIYVLLITIGCLLVWRQGLISNEYTRSERDTGDTGLFWTAKDSANEREFPGKRDFLESLKKFHEQLEERKKRGDDPQILDSQKRAQEEKEERLKAGKILRVYTKILEI